MKKTKWIAMIVGTLLAAVLLGTALAEPPTPTNPSSPPPPGANWESMRNWMDSIWGEGFFDRMHSSPEAMTESCNTMMGSGGMMGAGGMMGSGGMMGNWSGGATQGRYGGMMGGWNQTSNTGRTDMMNTYNSSLRSRMRAMFY